MLEFSEEQAMAQQAIRAWCKERLEPRVPAMEGGELDVYGVMRDFGATFGIADLVRQSFERRRARAQEPKREASRVPAMENAFMAIVMMELSRVCPGFALAFGASLGLFGGAVMARGTDAQREAWALPALTLEKIGAWALTEPGAGSDAFGSMRTVAKPTNGGFLLSGSKTFITNAPFADLFLVYARVVAADDGDGDIRAFLVARGEKGLATGKPLRKMGMHASPTGELFLDEVFVPDDQLLGGAQGGSSRAAAKASLSNERFGMTPMCLGIVDRCLDESVRYAKERTQWGRPIAEFQLVQEKIAKMFTARTIMQALLFRQLEADRAGVPLTAKEASAAKLYCARAATECALDAVQLEGGAGYMAGSVVEMLARDAKLFQIGGGTDEIQILRIARELLG